MVVMILAENLVVNKGKRKPPVALDKANILTMLAA